MNDRSTLHFTPVEYARMMATLKIDFIKLAQCLVSPGSRLILGATDVPGIHYNLRGCGQMVIGEEPPIDLYPHTLVIVPPGQPFRIEVQPAIPGTLTTVDARWNTFASGTTRKFIAGTGETQLHLICGYFLAIHGDAIQLFGDLQRPIVQQFSAADQLGLQLGEAIDELLAQEVGTEVMTASLITQVLCAVLRRSISDETCQVSGLYTREKHCLTVPIDTSQCHEKSP